MNVTDGDRGQILIKRFYDHDACRDVIYIERADPRALISPELLDEITEGKCAPYATIAGDQLDVITLTDDHGQRFIYRLGKYDWLTDAFEMEWPD